MQPVPSSCANAFRILLIELYSSNISNNCALICQPGWSLLSTEAEFYVMMILMLKVSVMLSAAQTKIPAKSAGL